MSKDMKGEATDKARDKKLPKKSLKVRKLRTAPDIELAGLKIWIHKYQFPDVSNYYDSNWLVATACCLSRESEIWINGAFLLTADLEDWINCLAVFDYAPEKVLKLISLENQVMIDLTLRNTERMYVKVEITPCGNQQHFYYYDVKPWDLNGFVDCMKKVLTKFPVRGR